MASSSEIEKLERRYSENPEGRFFAPLADAYRKAGLVDRALELVRAGLTKHPDYLSAHIVLGRCFLDKGNDPEALATFQAVLGLDSENIIALKSLAEISERGGRADEAKGWLQKLLVVDPMNTEAEADLQRLGGAAAAPSAAPVVTEAAAVAPETSFADVAREIAEPVAMAEGAAPVVAEAAPPPPQPPPLTVPEPVSAGEPPIVAVEALKPEEPSAPAIEAAREPESVVAEKPSDLGLVAFQPPPPSPAPTAEAGGGLDLLPFDDSLAWGTGERSSRAIHAEDVEGVAHDETVASPAIEFATSIGAEPAAPASASGAPSPPPPAAPTPPPGLDFIIEPPPDQSIGGFAAPAEHAPAIELPADLSGAYSIVDDAADDVIAPPPVAEAPATGAPPAAEPAPALVSPGLSDLPLIMPEDVTPPEELARPSAKMVQVLSPPPAEESTAGPGHEAMVTETMGDLYMRQGFRSEAADVYRRVLSRRPSDGALAQKLRAAEGPPPDLSAAALGVESVGAWLRRVAGSRLSARIAAASPQSPASDSDAPTPLEAAFAEPRDQGEPAHPAPEAFSLDQIFGPPPSSASGGGGEGPSGTTASLAPAQPTLPPPPAAPSLLPPTGASFDEFFGHPAVGGTPRPTGSAGASGAGGQGGGGRGSDEDLSAFSAWLQGLKK